MSARCNCPECREHNASLLPGRPHLRPKPGPFQVLVHVYAQVDPDQHPLGWRYDLIDVVPASIAEDIGCEGEA